MFPPVEDTARERHGPGQRRALVPIHALKEHGHGEGGSLLAGDVSGREIPDERLDLGRLQNRPVDACGG